VRPRRADHPQAPVPGGALRRRAIVFPPHTHGAPDSLPVRQKKLKPWRTAAECIDWSIPCPSIFERERPLAEATLRRIAKGVMRYVVNAAEPFIVPSGYGERAGQQPRTASIRQPLATAVGANKHALVVPTIAPFLTEHANASTQRNFAADEPLRTQVAQVKGGHFALVSAFLAKHYGGVVGSELPKADRHRHQRGPPQPGGQQPGEAARHQQGRPARHRAAAHDQRAGPAPRRGARLPDQVLRHRSGSAAAGAAAHRHHEAPLRPGDGRRRALRDRRHRHAHAVAARAVPRAGLPESYQIDRGGDGRVLTKTAQVRMCGNSVCPPMAEAYVRANYSENLLPCPFCGARPDWTAGMGWFAVECTGCHVETDAYTEPDAAQAVWNRRVTAGVEADAPHDPLRQAAEQFVASCKDGNVADLIDYYEEIFTEALGVAGTLNDQGEKA
jgi:DNA (cytosine-5)-methyltransferase 1